MTLRAQRQTTWQGQGGIRHNTTSRGGTYFVRNMEFIDQVEVEEHSQDNLESLAVMVLGVIEFITKTGKRLTSKEG